jgi:hypothetical protein
MKSIMHERTGECYLCAKLYRDYGEKQTQVHHAIFGMGRRKLSEKYGLTVHLCLHHHTVGPEAVHNNHIVARIVQRDAQKAFEARYPNLSFREIFGMNYLTGDNPSPVERKTEDFYKLEEENNESNEMR